MYQFDPVECPVCGQTVSLVVNYSYNPEHSGYHCLLCEDLETGSPRAELCELEVERQYYGARI